MADNTSGPAGSTKMSTTNSAKSEDPTTITPDQDMKGFDTPHTLWQEFRRVHGKRSGLPSLFKHAKWLKFEDFITFIQSLVRAISENPAFPQLQVLQPGFYDHLMFQYPLYCDSHDKTAGRNHDDTNGELESYLKWFINPEETADIGKQPCSICEHEAQQTKPPQSHILTSERIDLINDCDIDEFNAILDDAGVKLHECPRCEGIMQVPKAFMFPRPICLMCYTPEEAAYGPIVTASSADKK